MTCKSCGSKCSLFIQNLFDDRYGSPGFFSIYRCNSCGFGRTDPVLKKTEIGRFYKKYYPLSTVKASEVKKSLNNFSNFLVWLMGIDLTAHRHIKSQAEVLDIGSASGVSLLEIKKMGAKAYGIEPDPSAQKLAKKLGINVFSGFVTDNPYPGKKFDYITASQVLEHEPDPLLFLLAAKRKLRKDGEIILSFPNFDSIYRKVFNRIWLNWHVPYHINFFTKASVQELANKTGLNIKILRTITPNIWTVYQIKRMFIKSEVGVKNILWSNNNKLFPRIINLILFIITTPINRLTDMLGWGDGILVVLEYEK